MRRVWSPQSRTPAGATAGHAERTTDNGRPVVNDAMIDAQCVREVGRLNGRLGSPEIG